MTNPINVVPKTDNDGSRLGRETRRWTEGHIINIKSNVLRLLNKALAPSDTTNAIYVLNNQLYFQGAAISGVSEEYIQTLIDNALATIEFVSQDQVEEIASTIATNLIAIAINNLSIPSNLSDLNDVNVSGVQTGDVVTWNGTEFVMQTPNDVVSNTLPLSDGTNNNSLDLASSDVLTILGTNSEVNVQLTTGANGPAYTISLPSNIDAKSSSSVQADKLTTARTLSLSGDASGSIPFDGSTNVSLPVSTVKATQLKNARTITLSGNCSGSVVFDGTTDVTIPTTVSLAAQANTLSTARTITISGDAVNQGVAPSFNGGGNLTIPITVNTANQLKNARKITLTGDASGSVQFNGVADVTMTTTVIKSSKADRLTDNKTISLTGPVTGSVSTNFSTNPTIATTIPSETLTVALTANITTLLASAKGGVGAPTMSTVFANNSALMEDPIAVFAIPQGYKFAVYNSNTLDGMIYPGAYSGLLHFRGAGKPGIVSNGSQFKVGMDYIFYIRAGSFNATSKQILWTEIPITSGRLIRKDPASSTYAGPTEDVMGIILPPAGPFPADADFLGLFYDLGYNMPPNFEQVTAVQPYAYGCTVTLFLTNNAIS